MFESISLFRVGLGKLPDKSDQLNSKIAILLTACVQPKGMAFTQLQAPETRLIQYQEALRFYLEQTPFRIVFCENSGVDFSATFQDYIDSGRLEYFVWDGNVYPRTLGKGYGEALIIEYALAHSKVLQEVDYILKITGRLIVRNCNHLVRSAFFWNYSRLPLIAINLRMDLSNVESQFILADKRFWLDFFLPQRKRLDDSADFYFEHLMLEQIQIWKKQKYYIHQFFFKILIQGYSGTSGLKYQTNYKRYFFWLRALIINFRIQKLWNQKFEEKRQEDATRLL